MYVCFNTLIQSVVACCFNAERLLENKMLFLSVWFLNCCQWKMHSYKANLSKSQSVSTLLINCLYRMDFSPTLFSLRLLVPCGSHGEVLPWNTLHIGKDWVCSGDKESCGGAAKWLVAWLAQASSAMLGPVSTWMSDLQVLTVWFIPHTYPWSGM